MHIFPEAHAIGQQLFLLAIYCYFIFNGSKLIATGCEILREIFGSGIVGSLVLPVLGAVPDGIIIVFALLGEHTTPEALEESISVGVGQLVGATVMLITIPVCVSIFLGSRKIDPETGLAMSEYKPISKGSNKLILKPVLPDRFSLWHNGVTSLPSTPKSVIWMLITSCTYLFVQIPAIFMHSDQDKGAHRERYFIFLGFIIATLLFIAYLYAMSRDDDNDHLVEERRQRGNKFLKWTRENRSLFSSIDPVTLFNLLDTNRDGFLSTDDIQTGFKLLGFHDISDSDALAIFNLADQDNDVLVDLHEWSAFVREFILVNENQSGAPRRKDQQTITKPILSMDINGNPDANIDLFMGNQQVDSADYTNESDTMRMRSPLKSPKLNANLGASYTSPSYADESTKLWNINNDNTFKKTPHNHNLNINNVAPPTRNISLTLPGNQSNEKKDPFDFSEPLLSNSTQNYGSGSYRGSTTNLFLPQAQAQGNNTLTSSNGSMRGGFQPPKFIRLESHSNFAQSSTPTNASAHGSQRDLFKSQTFLSTTPGAGAGAITPSHRGGNNDQANIFSNHLHHGSNEEVHILYEDPTRTEEAISTVEKTQIPPPIPPEMMSAILRWYLDATNNKVVILKIGNKMRWAVHLWAKRTRKLGHYSYTLENGDRALQLIKLDTKTDNPIHTRKRAESKAFIGIDMNNNAPGLGDSGSMRSSAPSHINLNSPHHNKHTIFDPSSAVYHQELWADLDLPRWCYASPQIHQWYLTTMEKSKTDVNHFTDVLNAIALESNNSDSISSDSSNTTPTSITPSSITPSPKLNETTTLPTIDDDLSMPLLLQLFKLADKDLSKSLSFDDVDRFALEWGLYSHDINKQVLQVIFYNIDIDYDRSLAVFDFRTFLEEFVKLPKIGTVLLKKAAGSQQRFFEGRIYTEKECEQWQNDVEDRNDDLNEKEQKELEYYAFCYHQQQYLGVDDREHKLLLEHEANVGLTPQQVLLKQDRIHKFLGFGSLLLGTSLILLFSDPLIEIVTALGKSSEIPAFYISFVVLPFVSNSSELITSLLFAQEKTSTSIALTLSSLYGAAIMNNTFCVAIFLLLLFIKNLPWVYSAEVIVVIAVQVIVGLITYRVTLRQVHGIVCACIFPLAVLAIWLLETVLGLNW